MKTDQNDPIPFDKEIHILDFLKHDTYQNEFEILASSCSNWMTHQTSILEDDQTQYISFDKSNSYIQINFQNYFIELTGYILSSSMNSYRYLRNWALFAYVDDAWILLDEHCDDDILKSDSSSLITIPIYCDGSKYKSFRLVQTGHNNKSDHILSIRYFDLIGKLS